jgi:DNA repair protein RadC
MRINVYNTLLDDDRKPMLVKESSSNFPAVSQIKAPQDLVKVLNGVFNANNQTEEHVWLIALNSANAIIGIFELSHGSINSSIMSTREIFMKDWHGE